jgi:flagellum-specific peptidoglycan hydrolase FlgJ
MKNLSEKQIFIGSGVFLLILLLTQKKKISKMLTGNKKEFVNLIKPYAISIGNKIGVPPLFIMAQLCLESGYGKSSLTSKYFNFGGIKSKGNEPFVRLLTTECKGNVCSKVYQNFRKFNTIQEGMEAQAKVYQNVNFKMHLNKTTNPITYATLIQSGVKKYATAPNYVNLITNVINTIKDL